MKDPKKFKCPKCKALVGEPCRSKNHRGGISNVRPHKERMQMKRRRPQQTPGA